MSSRADHDPAPVPGSPVAAETLCSLFEDYWEALRRGQDADPERWGLRHPDGMAGRRDLRLLAALYDTRRCLLADSGTGPGREDVRSETRLYRPEELLQPGTMLGEFRIEELVGGGGMARVYKAFHTRLRRSVALKVLPSDRRNDPNLVARFGREMEIVGKPDHPHIVRATHAGESQGIHYLVMDLIDGVNLKELVRRHGPLSVADACQVIYDAALALQHAHEKGLVHRDLKPSNLMLTPDGRVMVLDFGLARSRRAESVDEELTGSEHALGTPDYMAPEQWLDSRAVDIRADIYSLGCTLYFLLASRAPFGGPDYDDVVKKKHAHEGTPVPPLKDRRPDLPEALDAVLQRMLAKQPADRFADPGELAEALKPISRSCNLASLVHGPRAAPAAQEPQPTPGGVSLSTLTWPRSPRRSFIACAAFLLIALSLVAAVLWQKLAGPTDPGPLRVVTFETAHYRFEGDRVLRLSNLEESGSGAALVDDHVKVFTRLNQPGYGYILVFRADGQSQIGYPLEGKPGVPPGPTQEIHYPGEGKWYRLNEGVGVHAFVLVVARQPPPPEEWKTRIGELPWRKAKATTGWRYDGREFTPLGSGQRKVEEMPVPQPFRELCESLKRWPEVEAIHAVAFPVLSKDQEKQPGVGE